MYSQRGFALVLRLEQFNANILWRPTAADLKRIESRSPPHAIEGRETKGMCDLSRTHLLPPPTKTARDAPLSLTQLGILVFLAVYWIPAFSEIDRSAYRHSTIEEVVAQHGLKVGTSEPAGGDTFLIAPEYKYRLQLKATGRIRELTPDAAAALSAWSQTHPDLPAFLKEYTHEVEVTVDDKPVWLIWQRALVAPFRAERSDGGDIEVYAILAGTFRGKLLLLVTAFVRCDDVVRHLFR
jgi:hypothetical protein